MTKLSQSFIHAQIISRLKNKDSFRFKVIGNCMQPLIQKGDWVLIEPCFNRLKFQPGDIVLIDRGMDFVIHRLIRINTSEIISRGDWARFPDPPAKLDQVLGHVVEIEKHGYRFPLNHPFIRIFNRINYFISSQYRKCVLSIISGLSVFGVRADARNTHLPRFIKIIRKKFI